MMQSDLFIYVHFIGRPTHILILLELFEVKKAERQQFCLATWKTVLFVIVWYMKYDNRIISVHYLPTKMVGIQVLPFHVNSH